VGPVRVVLLDVLGKDCFEVTAAEDGHPVRYSRRNVPITHSQMALARGARTGLLMILVPSAAKMASKGSGELGVAITDEELDRARVLGELHREVPGLLGCPTSERFDVMPAIRTRRVSWWMNTRT
jgi:hypothetical protein